MNRSLDMRASLPPRMALGNRSSYLPIESSYNLDSKLHKKSKVVVMQEFDASDFVRPGVSLRDVEIYKEVFDLFSLSDTGMLTPMDLRNCMESFGYHPTKLLVYRIVQALDMSEMGGLNFGDFITCVTSESRDRSKDTPQSLKKIFSHYDKTGKGYYTKTELHEAARELGEVLEPDVIDNIFKEMAKGDPEKITFDEFCDYLLK